MAPGQRVDIGVLASLAVATAAGACNQLATLPVSVVATRMQVGERVGQRRGAALWVEWSPGGTGFRGGAVPAEGGDAVVPWVEVERGEHIWRCISTGKVAGTVVAMRVRVGGGEGDGCGCGRRCAPSGPGADNPGHGGQCATTAVPAHAPMRFDVPPD